MLAGIARAPGGDLHAAKLSRIRSTPRQHIHRPRAPDAERASADQDEMARLVPSRGKPARVELARGERLETTHAELDRPSGRHVPGRCPPSRRCARRRVQWDDDRGVGRGTSPQARQGNNGGDYSGGYCTHNGVQAGVATPTWRLNDLLRGHGGLVVLGPLSEVTTSIGRCPVEAGQFGRGERNLSRLRRRSWRGCRRGGLGNRVGLRCRSVAGCRRLYAGDGASFEMRRRLDRWRQVLEYPADMAKLSHGHLAVTAAGQVTLKLLRLGCPQSAQHPVGGFGVGEIGSAFSQQRNLAHPERSAAPAFPGTSVS